jgi:molybdenum cofactor cytidylyltransferase
VTKVGAIILAAGRSTRMGRNKMLEPVNGKAMLLHVVESVRDAGLAGPIIALGHEVEKVALCLRDHAHIPVLIPDHGEGMSRSLRGAVTAIPADWDAAVIALGDMPFISAELLREMAELAREDRIVVPLCAGKQGNPVVWGCHFFAELKACQGDQGAKPLIAEHPSAVVPFATTDTAVHRDIDELGDFD